MNLSKNLKRKLKLTLLIIFLNSFLVFNCIAQETPINWNDIPRETRVALYEAQQLINQNQFEQAISELIRFQKRRSRFNHYLIEFNIGTCYGFIRKCARKPGSSSPWMNCAKFS